MVLRTRESWRALLAHLKSILRSYDVHFFCLGCPIATLQAVRREPRPWIVLDSDPYVMVHEELIYRTVRMVRESIRPDTIAFIFDENAKVAAFNDISWAEFKRSVYPSSVAQCMTTLVPLDDKQFPALQAADLIAHTARRTFDKQLANGSIKMWRPLRHGGVARRVVAYGDLQCRIFTGVVKVKLGSSPPRRMARIAAG
jgi:hypothetical protein